MNSEQLAAIERLRELEKKATPGDWITGSTQENAIYLTALRDEGMPLIEALQAENERLRKKEAKLKETLLPVCEYAAEIYNRGIPAIPMPDDTIQRLNWAFKMFGG